MVVEVRLIDESDGSLSVELRHNGRPFPEHVEGEMSPAELAGCLAVKSIEDLINKRGPDEPREDPRLGA